ncbi:MAG: hypothetical protein JKY60_13590 [Kordiimonadaceae bacterium]|nr:hypothetical protein [Kordiimonadaceae bacterium]
MTSFSSENLPPVPPGGQMNAWPISGHGEENASATGLELYAFLTEKTGGQRFLRRSDFTPAEVQKWLPNISVFDLVYDGSGLVVDAIIRLLGSSAVSIYGEHTGKSIFSHSPTTGENILGMVQMMVAENQVVVGLVTKHFKNRPDVQLRALCVPISENGVNVNQMLIHLDVRILSS